MSDAAFKAAAYPGYTTKELEGFIAKGINTPMADEMRAEIARRERVAAGDYSVATDGERLRAVRAGKL